MRSPSCAVDQHWRFFSLGGSFWGWPVESSPTYLFAVLFGLLFATPLLELELAQVHHRGRDEVHVVLFLFGEAQNVEGLLSVRVRPRKQQKTNVLISGF